MACQMFKSLPARIKSLFTNGLHSSPCFAVSDPGSPRDPGRQHAALIRRRPPPPPHVPPAWDDRRAGNAMRGSIAKLRGPCAHRPDYESLVFNKRTRGGSPAPRRPAVQNKKGELDNVSWAVWGPSVLLSLPDHGEMTTRGGMTWDHLLAPFPIELAAGHRSAERPSTNERSFRTWNLEAEMREHRSLRLRAAEGMTSCPPGSSL